MSKLIDMYKNLKNENSDTLYLFKCGMFYIFIDDDAKIISEILCLKLTNLNSETLKCGFPVNSLNKYLHLLNFTPYKIKIIDTVSNISYKIEDFTFNQDSIDLLNMISNIDENNLSVKDAYEFIYKIKIDANKILETIKTNEKLN